MANKNKSNSAILDENDYYKSLPRAERKEFRAYISKKMEISEWVFMRKRAGDIRTTPSEAYFFEVLAKHYEDVRQNRILQLS